VVEGWKERGKGNGKGKEVEVYFEVQTEVGNGKVNWSRRQALGWSWHRFGNGI